MKEILKETKHILEKGRPVVWATMVAHAGSTPRKTAARMLVTHGGRTLGSVGGGRLEAEALEAATGLFANPGSRIIDVSMTGHEVAETDMICGGSARLYVELLSAEALPLVQRLSEQLNDKAAAFFLTVVREGRTAFEASHFLLERDAEGPGTSMLPFDVARLVRVHMNTGDVPALLALPQGEGMLFLEPLERASTLYVFGGGHVSLDLAWLAHRVGFEVIVVDDRQAFANRERFPMASRVHAQPYTDALKDLELGADDFVVIVTRGHLYDLEVLREVIAKTPDYIGMIGSRRKKAIIFDRLQEEGISRERLEKVYSPIGLSIEAQTPVEISVSIVAELIQVRAEIKRQRMAEGT